MNSSASMHGSYHIEHIHDGKCIWSETVNNQLFNEGQYAILDIALRGGTAPASWYMGLMNNNLQQMPARTATLSSLNALGPYELSNGSDPGYTARQAINRDATGAGWPTLTLSGVGELATAVTVGFHNTSGSVWPDTVRWLFLTTIVTAGDTAGKLISMAELAQDRTLQPGDRVNVSYSLLLT